METKETEPQKHFILSSSAKWIAGTFVGIGTGLAKFVTEVRSEFYENVIKGPDFKSKLEEHGKKLGDIKAERREGLTDTKTFIKKFHKQKNDFAAETNAFSEELGIISHGVEGWTKGTLQRYQTLSENVRTPLVFAAITTTVIGFAGTSMFMNSLANRKKIDKLSKTPAEQHDSSYQR